MDGRRAVAQRGLGREERGQLLVVDVDERRGVGGGLRIGGHDRRHAVAHKARRSGEQGLVFGAEGLPGQDAVAAVGGGRRVQVREDGDHAGQRLAPARVDPRDAGVGHGAEHQLGVKHAGSCMSLPYTSPPVTFSAASAIGWSRPTTRRPLFATHPPRLPLCRRTVSIIAVTRHSRNRPRRASFPAQAAWRPPRTRCGSGTVQTGPPGNHERRGRPRRRAAYPAGRCSGGCPLGLLTVGRPSAGLFLPFGGGPELPALRARSTRVQRVRRVPQVEGRRRLTRLGSGHSCQARQSRQRGRGQPARQLLEEPGAQQSDRRQSRHVEPDYPGSWRRAFTARVRLPTAASGTVQV